MKYALLIIIIIIVSNKSNAQHSASYVYYEIDSISVDSFYLKTNTITTIPGLDRKDTLVQYQLFTDTTDFITYVGGRQDELTAFNSRYAYLEQEKDTLGARYVRLVDLGGGAESPFRSIKLPPELQNKQNVPETHAPIGVWVIYPPSSKVEYIYEKDIEKLNCTCIVLRWDGTTEKRKKKAVKKE